jgi:hypothetical protein
VGVELYTCTVRSLKREEDVMEKDDVHDTCTKRSGMNESPPQGCVRCEDSENQDSIGKTRNG